MTRLKPLPRRLRAALFAPVLLCACLISGAKADQAQINASLGSSGLNIPRYVSLGLKQVYVRTGPGKQYPIDWVYRRKSLPVQVIAEYDIWRRIKDHDGSTGWVHGSLLSGRRTVIIQKGIQTVYSKPELHSRPVLRAEPGVIAELKRCQPQWCEIQIEGKKGWTQLPALWGADESDLTN